MSKAEDFAKNFLESLNNDYFRLVWEKVSKADKELTASIVQFDLGFLMVLENEVILFKDTFSDGWEYFLLGEPEIAVPMDTPDSVVAFLQEKLPGINIRKAVDPVPTAFQEYYSDRIQGLVSKAYKA